MLPWKKRRAYTIESDGRLFIIESFKEAAAWAELHFLKYHSCWLVPKMELVVQEWSQGDVLGAVTNGNWP